MKALKIFTLFILAGVFNACNTSPTTPICADPSITNQKQLNALERKQGVDRNCHVPPENYDLTLNQGK